MLNLILHELFHCSDLYISIIWLKLSLKGHLRHLISLLDLFFIFYFFGSLMLGFCDYMKIMHSFYILINIMSHIFSLGQFVYLFERISVTKHWICLLGVPILLLCKILYSLIVCYIISTVRLSFSQISVSLPRLHHATSHHIVLSLSITLQLIVVSRSWIMCCVISIEPFDYVDNLRLI